MRAREPDATGRIERDGIAAHWERCGHGAPPVLLLNADPIVQARTWKGQIPYLARHHCGPCVQVNLLLRDFLGTIALTG